MWGEAATCQVRHNHHRLDLPHAITIVCSRHGSSSSPYRIAMRRCGYCGAIAWEDNLPL